uniref:Uncharacterized protein n=1 Tax=Strombidinopsis acuminata TaxID=141414 RepID=A0A7S3U0C7_9SPIT|mmetsp:Transcript_36235/g.93452  ORF Transcript_36235/g.93452 Transcript_36235/m.93452 type:complete len:162 (+) Transcript_36235:67-552(+)
MDTSKSPPPSRASARGPGPRLAVQEASRQGAASGTDRTVVAEEEPGISRFEQMMRHGAATEASPATRHRINVPGPGTYNNGKKDEALVKVNNVRSAWSTRPRFLKEGAFFNASEEYNVPGPGSYLVDKKRTMGQYKVGREPATPRWTMRRRPPLEFAKITC